MSDLQSLQLILFGGGVALTCGVLVISFGRIDRVELEISSRRRMRRRLSRMLRLPSE